MQNEPLEPAEMTRDREKYEKRLAVLLVLFCLMAAVGNWIFGIRQKIMERDTHASQIAGLTGALFERADIGIISIEGTIMHGGDGGFNSKNASSDRIIAALRQARHEGVKGLLIKINSPGGTAAASQAIYEQIRRLRQEDKIKVLASMGDLAASGGYYIACSADAIVANPATLTGSIGVIAQFSQLKGLMDKVGVSMEVIKSGKHKDIGSPFRQTSPEDRKILQGIIDDTYDQFLSAVAQGRRMPKAKVRPLADGRIFTGRQALQRKMVDKLGDYTVALEMLKKLSGVPKQPRIKDYTKPPFSELLSIFSSWGQVPIDSAVRDWTKADLQKLDKVPLMLYL